MAVKNGTREYFEKLRIAEEYCNGDTAKARKLLTGEFNDLIFIKGRFQDDKETLFGFFYTVISTISYRALINDIKITDYTSVNNNKTFNVWGIFLEKFNKARPAAEIDPARMIEHNLAMKSKLTMAMIVSIVELVRIKDNAGVTQRFTLILGEIFGTDIEADIDFEETTSVILHDAKLL